MPFRKTYAKRPTAGTNRRTTVAKRTYPARRVPRPMAQSSDQMKLLLTQYVEIQNLQGAAGNANSKLSYSLKCDPKHLKLKLSGAQVANAATEGLFASMGDNTGAVAAGAAESILPLARWTTFKTNFRQYKIDFVNIKVMVDRECGLDNPVCFCSDKGDEAPITNMGKIQSQAHKQYTMTESNRTASYGWKPTSASEKEFKVIEHDLVDAEFEFLKVFQDIETKSDGLCKHRVSITMGVTLKDSQGLN